MRVRMGYRHYVELCAAEPALIFHGFCFPSIYLLLHALSLLLFCLSLPISSSFFALLSLTELQVGLLSKHILHSPSPSPLLPNQPPSLTLSASFLTCLPLSIVLSLTLPPSPFLSLPPLSLSLPSFSPSFSLPPSYFGIGDGVCCQFHHGKVSFPNHLLKLVEPDRCLLTRDCHDI